MPLPCPIPKPFRLRAAGVFPWLLGASFLLLAGRARFADRPDIPGQDNNGARSGTRADTPKAPGTSLLRGAIAGVVPGGSSIASDRLGRPGGHAGSALNRGFQEFVTELRRASHTGPNGEPVPAAISDDLTPTDALDTDFGTSSLQLGLIVVNRSSSGAALEAMAVWSAQFLDDLKQSRTAASNAIGFGRSLVPIYVTPEGFEAGSRESSIVSIGHQNTPGPGLVPDLSVGVPTVQSWSSLVPGPATGSSAPWTGSASFGSWFNAPPRTAPPSNFASAPAPVSGIRFSSFASSAPVVVATASPVPSVAPAQSAKTASLVASPAVVVASAPASAVVTSMSSTAPQASTGTIYVGQNGGNYVVGTFDMGTGAALNTGFINSGLSGPEGLVVGNGVLYVSNALSSKVGTYNATTGVISNANFISGLLDPETMLLSGNTLFVADWGNARVGTYNATTGAAFNASFITGLVGPWGLALSSDGTKLFVSNENTGKVGEYNASTGAVINASFITGLSLPTGVAVMGNNLYVAENAANRVGEYNATTGAVMSAGFITSGFPVVGAIAIQGNNLFITDERNNRISEYNATNGAVINASLITGVSSPQGIAVVALVAAPEPSTSAMLAAALLAVLCVSRPRRRTA